MYSSLKLLGLVGLAVVLFGTGYAVRTAQPVKENSQQKDLDAYCNATLNDDYLSKLSVEDRKETSQSAFFSPTLHTCVHVEVLPSPNKPEAMNYVVSDLTHDFTAPAKWHADERPLHLVRADYGSFHHIYVEGYWKSVSSDPGQQPVATANRVKLDCDYDSTVRSAESNNCIEYQGYADPFSIQVDHQTYHIASWNPDEIIATDVERGLSGSTTTTLLIHPNANEIEVVDRTNMDTKQPKLLDGMAGKSFGDHYELKGGMYLWDTQGTFFQCDQEGTVTDMRLDVVRKYHGDVVNVPASEWNAGSKSDRKFTQRECESAMEKKLQEMK
jgi:hypothetical protein